MTVAAHAQSAPPPAEPRDPMVRRDDRFVPISYLKNWEVVRDVAIKSGTPYNKTAYDAETKREADAAAKKAAEQQKKQ